MVGNLILHEKGRLGYKETILHSGEGPIWQVRWCNNLIARANDLVCFLPLLVRDCQRCLTLIHNTQDVKIYGTHSHIRVTFIYQLADSSREDLHWQDENTLLIGRADEIKVARVRTRPRKSTAFNLSLPASRYHCEEGFGALDRVAYLDVVPRRHVLRARYSSSNRKRGDCGPRGASAEAC